MTIKSDAIHVRFRSIRSDFELFVELRGADDSWVITGSWLRECAPAAEFKV